jgi:hypothetical protein
MVVYINGTMSLQLNDYSGQNHGVGLDLSYYDTRKFGMLYRPTRYVTVYGEKSRQAKFREKGKVKMPL